MNMILFLIQVVMSNSRISRNKELPKRILILCEGESEIIYLKGFRGEEQNKRRLANVDIEIYQPKNYSPYGLLIEAKKKQKEAKKEKFPYKSVWIVFDRDGHANIPQTFEESKKADVKIAFSLICFEYWILLHFEKTFRAFKNSDEILSYIKSKKYIDYQKTNYYPQLLGEHKSNALSYSEWMLIQNETDLKRGKKEYELSAYTNFNKLINYLNSI